MNKITRLKENKKVLAICLVLAAVIIVMGIIFVPKAYKNYKHKKYMEKYFTAVEEPKPLKPLWTLDGGKEFTYKFKIDECDGEYTITAPKGHDDIMCTYQIGDEETAFILFFFGDKSGLLGEYPDTITGIKTADINFDGFTDILVTGTIDSKEKLWVNFGEESYYAKEDKEIIGFYDRDFINENIEDLLVSNFTVDDIENFFVGNSKNGKFKSYVDAYLKVIDFYECTQPGRKKYKLIYFDEDDIPELVVDRNGYHVSMYTFNNGYVCAPILDWPYGAMGNDGYNYKVKGNLITNFDQDGAGASGTYSGYGIIDGKIEEIYYHTFYNDDSGEDEDWVNEKLTKEQREALEEDDEDAEFDSLYGIYTATEILKQLNGSGFKVEKISGKSSVFNFNGKKYHCEVESLKNNKKVIWLSDGSSYAKKVLKCDNYKIYFFNRDDDKGYLYLFADANDNPKLYIYNLNAKHINSPIEYDGEYCICEKDIKNADCFTLIGNINDLGEYKAKRKFCIAPNGMPLEIGKYGYFFKTKCIDNGSNNNFGDALILQKDYTFEATKDLSEDSIYYSKEFPDDSAELVSLKKGTRFYLYKYSDYYFLDDEELTSRDYYLVNDDGYMINANIYYDNSGNVDSDCKFVLGNEVEDEDLYLKDFKPE